MMERYSELCKMTHSRLVQIVMKLEDDLLEATREKAAAVDHYRTAFASERRELMLAQETLFRERNLSARLSGSVIRKEREIARLNAEIARMDEIVSRQIAKEVKAEFGKKLA